MELPNGRIELLDLPIDKVREDELQPRKDFPKAEGDELTESVREHRVKEPITVYRDNDLFILISGARRLRSSIAAGRKTIPARVYERRPEPAELFLHQLLSNIHRVDLNFMEMCDCYEQLMAYRKINATELARLVSKSKTYVSNVLSLATLNLELQGLIRERKVGLATGAMLARMKPEEQLVTLEQLKAGKAVRREELERITPGKEDSRKALRRVLLELPSATMSIHGKSKLAVDDLIGLLQSLIRECKKARSQGLDLTTLACILRDRTLVAQKGGE